MLWHLEVIADFVKNVFVSTGKWLFLAKTAGFCEHWLFFENAAFSILIPSTKKQSYNFLNKGIFFQKISFRVKEMKPFEIPNDSHMPMF